MCILTPKEKERAKKDARFRRNLFSLHFQERNNLIQQVDSGNLDINNLPIILNNIWQIDEILELLVDMQFSSGVGLSDYLARWVPFMGLSIYQQWKRKRYEDGKSIPRELNNEEILQLYKTVSEEDQKPEPLPEQLVIESVIPGNIKRYSIQDQHIKRLEEEILSLKKQIRQRDKMIRKLTRWVRYKLGKMSDHDLEKLADKCRFKNGKINFSKMSRYLEVAPDTVKHELERRGLIVKLNIP